MPQKLDRRCEYLTRPTETQDQQHYRISFSCELGPYDDAHSKFVLERVAFNRFGILRL